MDKALSKLAGPSNPVIPRGEVPKAGKSGSSDPIVLAMMHRAEFSILDLFEVSFIRHFRYSKDK